ncbi:DUF6157 family protein [Niabella ginsengisoli]|uniref:DUF6157 family protein n=1 Tax=Niabella ginsengisoli TaxID=522298 RepID=A0ABS9SKB5_9BACT|nr:DUF6157 family protein [Niabella ginsengisoli]MCH5598814.1 DUF6157 family protein [Niabella ginsengisoli]
MKQHTTNYIDTFIEIAEDCPVETAEIPKSKNDLKTVAQQQYELIVKNPYKFTSDDIIFQVYAERNDLTKAEHKTARETFFLKGNPACELHR